MPAELRLISRIGNCHPEKIGVPDFLAFFYSDKIEAQEYKVRSMREGFRVREDINTEEDFRNELFRFFRHYQKAFWNAEFDPQASPEFAYRSLQELSRTDLHALKRDAMLKRNGGMIQIINEMSEALVEKSKESYMDHILFEYLPSHPELQMTLAEQLVNQYGRLLFPDDPNIKPYMLFGKIEKVLKEFALGRNAMQRSLRY